MNQPVRQAFGRRLRTAARVVSALAFAVAATSSMLACGGGGDGAVAPENASAVATVEVSQPSVSLGVGSTIVLQVVLRNAAGAVIGSRPITWSSSDNTIATVSPSGVVTALRTGSVQIAASVDGRSAVTQLTISTRAVAVVRVTPSELQTLVGVTVQLSASTLDDDGAPLRDRTVLWTSSDPRIASVDASGRVTGIAPGIATITASSEGRSVTVGVSVSLVPVARIDITPAVDTVVVGQSTQLVATLRDSIGGTLADRGVTWGTSDVAVATVSSSGVVVGVAAGAVTITVSSAGRTAQSRVVVEQRGVSTVFLSPGQSTLAVGQQARLTASLTDADGALVTGRPVQFRSDNVAIATVAADGTVTAVAVGSTDIVATSEGRAGRAGVTVVPVAVAFVRIEPGNLDLLVGATARLTATALDGSGVALTGRNVALVSSAPGVATVAPDGTVRALASGTSVVTASSEGKSATVTVVVRLVPVGTVSVAPASPVIAAGDVLDLTVTVRNAAGTVVTDRPVLWTSNNEDAVVVSSSGRIRAVAAGTAMVSASVDGVVGSTNVTVIPEPVLTVTVTPTTLSLALPNETAQLTAVARGRNGIALTGRTITFASNDATIATVTAGGLVQAVRAGTTTISVASEGRRADVVVTVTAAPVASITFALTTSALTVGMTTSSSVVLKDARGVVLAGRSVTYTTSNATVATVSPAGIVTATGAGVATITATSEGKSANAVVNVIATPVASITFALGASSLAVSMSTSSTVELKDSRGLVLTGRNITYTTSNAAIATVSAGGVVTATGAGVATITATSEGKSASATLTVTAGAVASITVTLTSSSVVAGSTVQATVVLRDASGAVLTGRAVIWGVNFAQLATISPTGLVTTTNPGSTTVFATSEGKIGSTPLTITPAPVATITITVPDSSIVVGDVISSSVVPRVANGTVVTGRTIAYASSNGAVATVSPTGVVTARGAGTTVISATSESRTASVTIAVAPPPVASVEVQLGTRSLAAGGTAQATAVLRDGAGNTLVGRSVTWSSTNVAVATVTNAGVITARSAGMTTITATSEGKAGTVGVEVLPAPVAAITVSAARTTITEDETSQATAVTTIVGGAVVTGRVITWSTSDPSVVIVSTTGLITARNVGSARVTATSEGKADTVAVTVTPLPVVRIVLTPATATVAPLLGGGSRTVQLTAVVYGAGNRVLLGRTVSYATSNVFIAGVNDTGLVTGVLPGTATITASVDGKSDTSRITVETP